MIRVSCKSQGWLLNVLEAVRFQAWAFVEDVLSHAMLAKTREAMYWVQRTIHQEVAEEKLQRAGELGILWLMLKFEPIFISFLGQDEVIAIIDSTATPTAILHLQMGSSCHGSHPIKRQASSRTAFTRISTRPQWVSGVDQRNLRDRRVQRIEWCHRCRSGDPPENAGPGYSLSRIGSGSGGGACRIDDRFDSTL
jgi:hypothetical protein